MTFRVHPWLSGSPVTLRITYRDAWRYCQQALLASVGHEAYQTWFSSLKFTALDRRGKVLRLTVASPFLRGWISKFYADLVLKVCQSEWPTLTEVDISVRSCVVRDLRSKPVLLLAAPPPEPVYVRPRDRYFPYTPRMLFPGHPDIPHERLTTAKAMSTSRFVEHIQRTVATNYNVSRDGILSGDRKAKVVKPRQVAMFLAVTLTGRSLPEIGRLFGGKDHTTVLHAVRKISWLIGERSHGRCSSTKNLPLEVDIALANEVQSLRCELQL